jgi:FtsP/CotA-like multicopper oxidase with cupredoxin domain
MRATNMKKAILKTRLLAPMVAVAMMLTVSAFAAAPGITDAAKTPIFNLEASPAYVSQPDGQMIYSWGYGCSAQPGGFAPASIAAPSTGCPAMQIPGPTLIVTEGDQVTVNLTNNLPTPAGNTSILFPGFNVTTSCSNATPVGLQGLLTCEAAPGGNVTYTFTAATPGTRAYYSGTQGDLQVEMGMYGVIIVLPNAAPAGGCPFHNTAAGLNPAGTALVTGGEGDYRLSPTGAAYHVPQSCYDREYLFQFSEIDPNVHSQALAQLNAIATCTAGAVPCPTRLDVPTEPYHPAYFMINGRSMPDDMDPNYAPQYPHQPYNGNPHMHPGEMVLLRIVGQGRWQHPFHEHGNHVRILGRDGNLISSQSDANSLAGPLLFTTTTTPGLAMDGIFYWTGRGLNWDSYGHNPNSPDPLALLSCVPDANGYNTGVAARTQINYYEWCADHNKPVQVAPFGDVAGGGPVTLPDANILTNGAWYGGSPYLGPNATTRATGCLGTNGPQTNAPNCGATGSTPPSGTIANPPGSEAGFAFMWHSHNEREITTNNIFPGGMMMMMLVDSREFVIDESN